MGKYIDTDRLCAEIDRIEEEARTIRVSGTNKEAIGADSKVKLCLKLKSIINSLQQEQPEVDLEKALNGLDNAYFDLDGIAVKGATYYLTVNDLKDIARDFYNLGLNARK